MEDENTTLGDAEVAAAEAEPNPLFAPEPEEGLEESAFDLPSEEDGEAAPEAEGEASDEAEAKADGEAEEDAEPKKENPLPPGVKRRMAQLARQKRDARRDADVAKTEAAKVKGKLETIAPCEAAVRQHYGQFKDPLRELAHDAAFMTTVEQLSKVSPEVQRTVQLVMAQMRKGGLVPEDKATTKATETQAAATPEPVAKLLRQATSSRIHGVLEKVGVKPGFKGILADHILTAVGDDPEVAEETVLRHAKEYVTRYGLAESDVVGPKKAKAGETTSRPATPKSSRAAIGERAPKASEKAPAEKGGPVRSLEAWEAKHNSRRANLLASMGS